MSGLEDDGFLLFLLGACNNLFWGLTMLLVSGFGYFNLVKMTKQSQGCVPS